MGQGYHVISGTGDVTRKDGRGQDRHVTREVMKVVTREGGQWIGTVVTREVKKGMCRDQRGEEGWAGYRVEMQWIRVVV